MAAVVTLQELVALAVQVEVASPRIACQRVQQLAVLVGYLCSQSLAERPVCRQKDLSKPALALDS